MKITVKQGDYSHGYDEKAKFTELVNFILSEVEVSSVFYSAGLDEIVVYCEAKKT